MDYIPIMDCSITRVNNNEPKIIRNLIIFIDNSCMMACAMRKLKYIIPILITKNMQAYKYKKIFLGILHPKMEIFEINENNVFTVCQSIRVSKNKTEQFDQAIQKIIDINNGLSQNLFETDKIIITAYNSDKIKFNEALNELKYINISGTNFKKNPTTYENNVLHIDRENLDALFALKTSNISEIFHLDNNDITIKNFEEKDRHAMYFFVENYHITLLKKEKIEKYNISSDKKIILTSKVASNIFDGIIKEITNIHEILSIIVGFIADAYYNNVFTNNPADNRIYDKLTYYLKSIVEPNDEDKIIIKYSIQFLEKIKISMLKIKKIIISDDDIIEAINKYNESSIGTENTKYIKNKLDKRILTNTELIDILKKKEINAKLIDFIEEVDDIDYDPKHPFHRSCEFFNSFMTLSNWFDEIQNNTCMCLVANISANEFSKLAIPGSRVDIQSISLNFMPARDYFESLFLHFKNNNNYLDGFGNINDRQIISDNIGGYGNSVIPLYINSHHWKIAKQYLKPLLGITLAHNPLAYTETYMNFMFYLLADMTRKTFLKSHRNSQKWIQVYFAVWRTCAEIAYEKGYSSGISKLIKNYIGDHNTRIYSRTFENDVLLGQILATGCGIDEHDIKLLCEYIYEDTLIRELRKTNVKSIFNFNSLMEVFCEEDCEYSLKTMVNEITKKVSYAEEILISFYKMYKIMKDLLISKFNNSFRKMLFMLDSNYGCLSDELSDYILKKIEKIPDNEKTTQHFYDIRNIKIKDIDAYIATYLIYGIEFPTTKLRKAAYDKKIINVPNDNVIFKTIIENYKGLYHDEINEAMERIKNNDIDDAFDKPKPKINGFILNEFINFNNGLDQFFNDNIENLEGMGGRL
jgi:hypothetical protein